MNTGTGEIQTDADTRESMDPLIAGTRQTNWVSDNLDLYNQRFSEIYQIDTANVSFSVADRTRRLPASTWGRTPRWSSTE